MAAIKNGAENLDSIEHELDLIRWAIGDTFAALDLPLESSPSRDSARSPN